MQVFLETARLELRRFTHDDVENLVELDKLGYRLRRSAWGKGYATEGSRALIQRGFTELGVERVVASTMVVNIASRRVMEKAGLKFVRTFHQPWPDYIEGQEEGDVEYALLRSEWEQPAAEAPGPRVPRRARTLEGRIGTAPGGSGYGRGSCPRPSVQSAR